MDEKNLTPQEEPTTPETETENKEEKSTDTPKKGGIFALCKEKKGLVIAIAIVVTLTIGKSKKQVSIQTRLEG